MEITKKLTPYNFTNKNDKNRVKYIVVHYLEVFPRRRTCWNIGTASMWGHPPIISWAMMVNYTSVLRTGTLRGTVGHKNMSIRNAGTLTA